MVNVVQDIGGRVLQGLGCGSVDLDAGERWNLVVVKGNKTVRGDTVDSEKTAG